MGRTRRLATVTLCSLVCASPAVPLVRALRAAGLPATPEAALSSLALVVLLACLAWAWAVAVAVVREAATGRRTVLARRAPAWLRRAVLAGCGVAVVSALAVPARAVDGPRHEPSAPASPVTGLPYPGLPAPAAAPAEAALRPVSAAVPRHAAPRAPRTHVVAPGESLWSITADLLGRDAGDARIAASWPLLHRANRDSVSDPDRLRPGQRLRIPPALRHPDLEHHHPSPLGRTRP